MKHYLLCITFLITSFTFSQSSEKENVKLTIQHFFEGFHNQDSTSILRTVHKDIKMQSISNFENSVNILNTTQFEDFLASIISIPKENTFREEILDYKIMIDGSMAHVWTPYKFYFNDKFSHCGVNSFQLFKAKDTWQIIYIVDTRQRNCK
nr:nuclear transport factor 2 family protein [uncultured Psychroserpens sp.]